MTGNIKYTYKMRKIPCSAQIEIVAVQADHFPLRTMTFSLTANDFPTSPLLFLASIR